MRTLAIGAFEGEVCAPTNIGARGLGRAFAVFERMILPASRANEFGVIVFVGARRFNMRVEGLAVITLNRRGNVFGDGSKGTRDG